MPKVKSATNYYRQQFEQVYGKAIRHDQWLQICKEVREAGLKIDCDTIKAYALFKKANPRKPLTKAAIQQLETFAQQYPPSQGISGREIASFIQKTMPEIKGYSIYKSFYKAGLHFKADQLYQFDRAYLALTYALTTRPLRRAYHV